jgi:hypothetical protein
LTGVLQKGCCTLAGLFLAVAQCSAQFQVGDNLHMNGSGVVSAGYAGNYGDQSVSSHNLDLGGNGNMSGFYYQPGFLSFNVLPFYNRSRVNSDFQSLTDSSGVNATANIFSGSHFPGFISYVKDYNSSGTFGSPDLPNFTTHGNDQSFGVGWSASLPNLPSISASFTAGSGDSTVYGTDAHSNSTDRVFSLRSSYTIAGFGLNADYNHITLKSTTPEILAGQQEFISNSDSDGYGFSASHALPLRGAFSAYASRLNYNNDYEGGIRFDTSIDTENASAVFRPSQKLNVRFGEYYTDNLAGSLNQAIIATGGVAAVPLASSSHSLSLSGGADYDVYRGLWVSGQVTQIDQRFDGQDYQSTLFDGTLYGTYGRKLLGSIRWSVSLVDTANEAGNSLVGVLGNVDFSRRIRLWDVSGSFSFAHNVETLLAIYTNSYYRATGQVSRRVNRHVRWSTDFGASHNALNAQTNSASSSENLSSSLSVGWFSTSGNYTRARGTSILTANGLEPIPVPIPVLPTSQLVLFGGSSYGLSAAAAPQRRLTLIASYTKAGSNTLANSLSSLNQNNGLNATLQYQLRKLYFKAGYSRLVQGISAAGSPPAMVSSYYFGVYRWFSFL